MDEARAPQDPESLFAERLGRLEAEVVALRSEVAELRAAAPKPPVLRSWPAAPAAVHEPAAAAVATSPVAGPKPELAASGAKSGAKSAAKGAAKSGAQLESDIGARVLSKVAVVLLLIGAALFLKWAFDNRWIGAGGRVAVGLAAGAAIVLWSERFRKQQMAAFGYALKAVGSGVLYLSLWASFQLYHLVPGWAAFAAMVGVTAWNAVMAWSQDSELLAGYALLGAYLTPVLLGTGGDHEVFLFSYLLVIALGVVALLRAKPWGLFLLGALPVTAGYFIGWYVQHFTAAKAGKTELFALLLWAAFAAVAMVARNSESVIVGVIAPLGAGVFGALTVYSVLADSGGRDWMPWWAVGFAAVYLALSRVRVGSLVAAMHLSLGVVFLTVAIPLKATGRGILLGWMLEAVALLVVSTSASVDAKAKRVLRGLGSVALALGVLGALFEPMWTGNEQAFVNRGFGMEMGAALALVAAILLSRRMLDERGEAEAEWLAVGAYVGLNIVLLVAMQREIARAFEGEAEGRHALGDFAFSGWLMMQGAANLVLGFWKRFALARWTGLLLLGVTVLKAFAYDMRGLSSGYRVVSYLALGVLLMAVSFAYQKDWLGLKDLAAVKEHEREVEG
jgi:uncharacterized membrane protein